MKIPVDSYNAARRAFVVLLLSVAAALPARGDVIPAEPVDIAHYPQFLFDLYIVDNHWGLRHGDPGVRRVVHQPRKHPRNPVLPGNAISKISNVWVFREPDGLFRMLYQNNILKPDAEAADPNEIIQEGRKQRSGADFVKELGYAESSDGIRWQLPALDLFPDWQGKSLGIPNNAVLESITSQAGGASIVLDIPERDRRGYRHVMMYRRQGGGGKAGIYLVGSHDGIHWDDANRVLISALASDTHNTLVYDPIRDEYVMFCRAKHIYRTGPGKGQLDSLYSRRVARMASKELWTRWDALPQTILINDEDDYDTGYKLYYGMPVRYYAGIYWGFLQHFRLNDYIYPELVVSRDGMRFDRLPGRSRLLDYGAEGTWDDTMIFASPWVEVGDEWWIYYVGADGPHSSAEKNLGVGLATVQKERLISLRGPEGGGVIVTRRLRWPGGGLIINADARGGDLKVRISDEARVPLAGFDFEDSDSFTEDSIRHEVTWRGKSLAALKDRAIRLEFHLRNSDLYTFRAGE